MPYYHGGEFGTLEGGRERPGQIVPEFFYQPGMRYKPDNTKEPSGTQEEFVRFNIIGDQTKAPELKVTERIRQMWKNEYEAFKRGEQHLDGEPLENWTPLAMQKGLIQLLKLNHCHTVEALAAISPETAGKIGLGVDELQIKARAYVDHKAGERPENRLKAMEAAIAALKAENDALREGRNKDAGTPGQAAEPVWRNRGRPPAKVQGDINPDPAP